MQNETEKQERIKAKLKELQELEHQMANEQDDLYEPTQEEIDAEIQQQQQQSEQKYYDLEQLLVAMWTETITGIALEVPMSDFKRSRLLMVRDKLLLEMDLSELIPREAEPAREPESDLHIDTHIKDDIQDIADEMVNPKFRESDSNKDLDTISQKLKDIDSKDGLMHPEEIPEEPSVFQKLMGAGKKKPVERTVDEKHQPSSMG